MKAYKVALRIWIGITSIFGFLGGWALLAHSGKPVPFFTSSSSSAATSVVQPASPSQISTNSTTVITVPTLPPLPTVQSGSTSTNADVQQQPVQITVPSIQFNQSIPQMVTRGS